MQEIKSWQHVLPGVVSFTSTLPVKKLNKLQPLTRTPYNFSVDMLARAF